MYQNYVVIITCVIWNWLSVKTVQNCVIIAMNPIDTVCEYIFSLFSFIWYLTFLIVGIRLFLISKVSFTPFNSSPLYTYTALYKKSLDIYFFRLLYWKLNLIKFNMCFSLYIGIYLYIIFMKRNYYKIINMYLYFCLFNWIYYCCIKSGLLCINIIYWIESYVYPRKKLISSL